MKFWRTLFGNSRHAGPSAEVVLAQRQADDLEARIEKVRPGLIAARSRNHFVDRIRLAFAEEQR